jgi:D-Tyr-tRNAtyr deacylase
VRRYKDRDDDIWTEGDDGLLRMVDYVGSYDVVNDAYGPLTVLDANGDAPKASGRTLDVETLLTGLRNSYFEADSGSAAEEVYARLMDLFREATQ